MLRARETSVLFDIAKPAIESFDLLVGKPLDAMAANVRCDATAKHTFWNWSLESTIPNEEHDPMHGLLRNSELLGDHTDVSIVLPQRILESIFAPENHLRPLRVGGVTKDPALHVFRLDHEDAES
jgi:hypothetical protein